MNLLIQALTVIITERDIAVMIMKKADIVVTMRKVVIVGIMCLFNPTIAAVSMGMLIGISIILTGVSVIALAL